MTNIPKVYKEYGSNYKQVSLNIKSGQVAKMYENRIHTCMIGEDSVVSLESLQGAY